MTLSSFFLSWNFNHWIILICQGSIVSPSIVSLLFGDQENFIFKIVRKIQRVHLKSHYWKFLSVIDQNWPTRPNGTHGGLVDTLTEGNPKIQPKYYDCRVGFLGKYFLADVELILTVLFFQIQSTHKFPLARKSKNSGILYSSVTRTLLTFRTSKI